MIPWLELAPSPADQLRRAAQDWARRQINARVLAEYRGASHGGIDASELEELIARRAAKGVALPSAICHREA